MHRLAWSSRRTSHNSLPKSRRCHGRMKELECLVLARLGSPVARNRLPLFPQQPTFSWPSLTSVRDPEATFVKLVTSRHDGAPSNNIQVARQEMCVLRRSKCALIVRNGHGAEFLIAKSARSRADHGLS
jgi:hypothetical protein